MRCTMQQIRYNHRATACILCVFFRISFYLSFFWNFLLYLDKTYQRYQVTIRITGVPTITLGQSGTSHIQHISGLHAYNKLILVGGLSVLKIIHKLSISPWTAVLVDQGVCMTPCKSSWMQDIFRWIQESLSSDKSSQLQEICWLIRDSMSSDKSSWWHKVPCSVGESNSSDKSSQWHKGY